MRLRDRLLKLYYFCNPCDIDRAKPLAPLGDLMAKLWRVFTYGTDCPCCLFTRLIVLLVVAFGVGLWLG